MFRTLSYYQGFVLVCKLICSSISLTYVKAYSSFMYVLLNFSYVTLSTVLEYYKYNEKQRRRLFFI